MSRTNAPVTLSLTEEAHVGSRVTFNHDTLGIVTGVIIAIDRSSIQPFARPSLRVKLDGFENWTCSTSPIGVSLVKAAGR